MQTWTNTDKSTWAPGEWQDEPDKAHWKDAATGLNCLIVRGPHGALCGYVGVPTGHPWHGVGYDDVTLYPAKPGEDDYDWDSYPGVHGGLTFASGCGHSEDPATGICHVPAPGESDDVWWLGFDCAHAGDLTGMSRASSFGEYHFGDDLYRDFAYVQRECASLARQAASVK